MRNSRKAVGLRTKFAALVIVALVVALTIPAASFAVTKYTLSIKAGASSVYTAQPTYIGGKVSPKVAGKRVTVQYKKTTSLVWKSVKVKTTSKSTWRYKFSSKSTGKYDFRVKYSKSTSARKRVVVKARTRVILASTTSTQDSGLFDVLIPAFEKAYPAYDINVVAVGSGQAIQMGKDKNADVLLVHSPTDEIAFVKGGWGTNRAAVMHNDFLLVGPTADPAGVAAVGDIGSCMKKIYNESVTFVSRGDDSGTHKKELALWKDAGYAGYPTGQSWYLKANSGMAETLRLAGEKSGYTIADRATWVTNRPTGMKSVQQGDSILRNPYSVIQVVGAQQPTGAARFSTWIRTTSAQQLIWNFGYKKYGQHLFWPDAD